VIFVDHQCEYTSDCKEPNVPDPIALLKQDHKEAKAMLKQLAASKPGRRRETTVKKLDAALRLHMQIEEDLVYPLVRSLVGREAAEEAEIEHSLAREGLGKLTQLDDEPGFGAAVAMLNAGIAHHVKEEEQEVFPQLKKEIDRAQLMQLGDEVARARRASRSSARAAL
jgi:iron-sulfur cluster repair protein YtfE (RIC family)